MVGPTPVSQDVAALTERGVLKTLAFFIPGSFGPGRSFLQSEKSGMIVKRLVSMQDDPIHVTQFNQLLHLAHDAGITPGFIEYYFKTIPNKHPFSPDTLLSQTPPLNAK